MKETGRRKHNLDILGLKNNATDDEIKLAYRKLAKKHHPDLNKGNPNALKDFLKLKNAYDGLMENPPGEIAKQSQSEPIFKNFEDFFDSIFDTFKKGYNFSKHTFSRIFNERPEPFVDLRKIIRDRERKKIS
jgi:DnaJ-class molecular chaperone